MENSELITKAITYAKSNFNNTDITLQSVADHAGFSIDYFNRIFLMHTGFTVMAYVNYIRIKNAVKLLRTTDKSILDIALEVGYDSHEGFIKAFKKIYNIAPGEYRKQNKSKLLCYGELADKSCASRFLHENADFKLIDSDIVIDYLLEKDCRRYGYICTTIKYMGLIIVAPDGDYERGFIGIGDKFNGDIWLEIVTDDLNLMASWLKRFNADVFYSITPPDTIKSKIDFVFKSTPQSLYIGEPMKTELPCDIIIRKLNYSDKNNILKWANGKSDGYIRHLLNEKNYDDPAVLEYGVFDNGELIAIAGCGIDEVHGFCINDCCNIRFADGKERTGLYRSIFAHVVNDIINRGVLPFDTLQHGEYAASHGGFSAVDMGFSVVNYRYDIISR